MIGVIRQAIKAKLETIDAIARVYDYLTLNPEGQPAAMVHYASINSEMIDSCTYRRIYTIPVYILQEISNRSREEAMMTIEQITDEFVQILEKDDDMGGEVHRVLIQTGDIGEYSNSSDGIYIGGTIMLQVETLHTRY